MGRLVNGCLADVYALFFNLLSYDDVSLGDTTSTPHARPETIPDPRRVGDVGKACRVGRQTDGDRRCAASTAFVTFVLNIVRLCGVIIGETGVTWNFKKRCDVAAKTFAVNTPEKCAKRRRRYDVGNASVQARGEPHRQPNTR